MIEGRNIICIASNWFYDPTSKHHVMRILSERNHVIWVNYHASRRPKLNAADFGAAAGKLRQVFEGPKRVSDSMTVITPLVMPLPDLRAATTFNRMMLGRQIKGVLSRLPERPVQLWSFAPDVRYLCGKFGEEAVVYYCVDEFGSFTGYNTVATLESERRLCEKADVVIATSRVLLEAKAPNCKRCELVTHGVDYDHFAASQDAVDAAPVGGAPKEIPFDVSNLPRPIFGFWGLMQDWFDVELVAQVASMRPGWSFVLIGEAAVDVSPLAALPNVHLPGRRPYESLPAYGAAFDVGLIPFRVNALTRAVNPIKLREYLSAGLPVVSTPMAEVSAYGQWVEIADGPAAFVAACERALTRRSAEDSAARRAAMRSETWRAKVERISELVMGAIGEKRHSSD